MICVSLGRRVLTRMFTMCSFVSEFIEGISLFSVKGAKEAKLRCK